MNKCIFIVSDWLYQSPHQSPSSLRPPYSVQPPSTHDCKRPSPSEGLWICFLLPKCFSGLIPSLTGGFLWTPFQVALTFFPPIGYLPPLNSYFSPAMFQKMFECSAEQPCSWVKSCHSYFAKSLTLECLSTRSSRSPPGAWQRALRALSEWVDWWLSVLFTRLRWMAPPCDSKFSFCCSVLLYLDQDLSGCLTVSFVDLSCPTSTLKAIAGPQHPPQGFGAMWKDCLPIPGACFLQGTLLSGP